MLLSLKIENIAIIESADIEFDSGLNVLTGETGAGKSIIIDSINAVLGEPARSPRALPRSSPAFPPTLPRGLKNMISSPTRTAIYFFAEPLVWTAKTPAA